MYYMKDTDSGQAHALMKTDLERDLGVYIASDMKMEERSIRRSAKPTA